MGKFRLVSWWVIFFFWGSGEEQGGNAPSLQIFLAIRPRVSEDGKIPGYFFAGKLGEIFVFFAVVVTIFCICWYICYLNITIIIITIIIIIIYGWC